jgi:hypothetical protein
VVLKGTPAPASSVFPATASVAFDPAGSCAVHTIAPLQRESASNSPVKVVVKTRSFETVAPPRASWGRFAVQSGRPVASEMATISPVPCAKFDVPSR